MKPRDDMGVRHLLAAAVVAVLATGCASGSGGPASGPSGGAADPPAEALDTVVRPPETPLVSSAPVFEPVVPPARYRRAVEAGTRSEIGRPGPDYWQQRVDYSIRATVNPGSATIVGSERIHYWNNSPDTLRSLVVHLYQNVFSQGVERNRSVRVTGGITLRSVGAQGRQLQELAGREPGEGGSSEAAGYAVQGTLARVFLPSPVPPGGDAELTFDWSYRVPGEDAFRTGRIGSDLFTVAQWYPQIATYDDLRGHDLTPYLGDGEFYLEYGSFDVEIEVPGDWLVSATGSLQNPEEVLPEAAVQRMRAAVSSDSVVRVAEASALEGEDRRVWRFQADSVRDFAFAASARYVWDAVGADVGGDRGRIRVDAFYDPAIEHWADAARYSKHSVEFFSEYLTPYPYPKAAATYGPVGGMEYPMIVFIGRSRPGEPLYSVLAHEFSHEWVPMLVGSHEADYAWMDEGLTTFNESLAREDFFGETDARAQDMERYLQAARAGIEVPLMRPTDYVENGYARIVAAYLKPAVLMHTLRWILGPETFDRAYRSYLRSWSYRHPMPWDFFRMMETAADQDLDWFWSPWFYGTATVDLAIRSVTQSEDGTVEITVENLGRSALPWEVAVETSSGIQTARFPEDFWGGRRKGTATVRVDGTVRSILLDPDRVLPDLDRSNNRWSPR